MKHRIITYGTILAIIIVLLGLVSCSVAMPTGGKAQNEPIKWKMATSWPVDIFPYTDGAKAICDRVSQLSNGRLVIEPYPTDAIVPAFGVFNAVSQGEVECGHSWPGYWRTIEPSFELFSSIPNQMTQQEWLVWLYGPTSGMDLWRGLYSKYNVVPFPGGLSGPEFGFFTIKPVRRIEEFKGLKLRAVGMASDILNELGATTVSLPMADIIPAMKNGIIDGCEFGTPAIDWQLGFQEVAKYVCLPSWHQPSAMYETLVNSTAWEELPEDLKVIFNTACKEVSFVDYVAELEGENTKYFNEFVKHGTEINLLDDETITSITEIANKLADEQAEKDSFYAKVLKSQRDFKTEYRTWEQWGNYELYQ